MKHLPYLFFPSSLPSVLSISASLSRAVGSYDKVFSHFNELLIPCIGMSIAFIDNTNAPNPDVLFEYNLDIGLGLTNLPIYSSSNENLLFLFGEAHIKYMCAVVSTHNLIELFNFEDFKLKKIERRIYKEVIHEIGHLILDYGHCLNDYCVMRFSKNIKEIDSKSIYLCEKCKLKLEKVRVRDNF